MNSSNPDWHLRVGVITLIVGIIAAIPPVYEFVEERFFLKSDVPVKQQIIEKSVW